MNKEQQQIIDEIWRNYRTAFVEGHVHQDLDECLSLEEFIEEIKSNNEFSEKWGLHIEERELSLEERMNEFLKLGISPSEFRKGGNYGTVIPKERTLEVFDTNNIPTKVLTLTYKNETIECYEN